MTIEGERGKAGRGKGPGPKMSFWSRTVSGWCLAGGAIEAAFVNPGRPVAWRREDPGFNASCELLDRDADRLVVDSVRRRALGGDPHAQGLAFRAARGFARPVDVSIRPRGTEALPPEVAAAMIEAGLAAFAAAET